MKPNAFLSLHLLCRKIRLLSDFFSFHNIAQQVSAFYRWLAPSERHFTGHSKTVLQKCNNKQCVPKQKHSESQFLAGGTARGFRLQVSGTHLPWQLSSQASQLRADKRKSIIKKMGSSKFANLLSYNTEFKLCISQKMTSLYSKFSQMPLEPV